jgi:hypothetical protein
MSSIPIRVRLTLAFAIAMACVIGAMALLVYVRVGTALLDSVDQTLRAQAQEALAHTNDEHGPVDNVDATGGRTLAQLLGPGGAVTRSVPAGLSPMLSAADAARVLHGAKLYRLPATGACSPSPRPTAAQSSSRAPSSRGRSRCTA